MRSPRRPGKAGTTAIEFAIVAPVLLLLLGSLVETAAFILLQTQLQFATDSAARQIRTGQVGPANTLTGTSNQMALPAFKTLVCAKFYAVNCATRIRVDVQKVKYDPQQDRQFSQLKTLVPDPLTQVGPQTPGANYTEQYLPGAPGDVGSLIVTYDWNFVIPLLRPVFGNVSTYPGIRRLAGLSIYRNEN